MDKFLENYNLSNLAQKEIESQNNPIVLKDSEYKMEKIFL